jgi:hypothetical protein
MTRSGFEMNDLPNAIMSACPSTTTALARVRSKLLLAMTPPRNNRFNATKHVALKAMREHKRLCVAGLHPLRRGKQDEGAALFGCQTHGRPHHRPRYRPMPNPTASATNPMIPIQPKAPALNGPYSTNNPCSDLRFGMATSHKNCEASLNCRSPSQGAGVKHFKHFNKFIWMKT